MAAPQETPTQTRSILATMKITNSETVTLFSVIWAYSGISGMIDNKMSDLPLAKLLTEMF